MWQCTVLLLLYEEMLQVASPTTRGCALQEMGKNNQTTNATQQSNKVAELQLATAPKGSAGGMVDLAQVESFLLSES